MELLDIYLPLFTHTINVIQNKACLPAPDQSEGDQASVLRQTLLALHETALYSAGKKNYVSQDISSATFAAFICLDEIILCSRHVLAETWHHHLLQNELPGRGLGGVMFFENLSAIDENNHSLRIVYLFCLFLGYKGRYIQDGDAPLEIIIAREIDKLPPRVKNCLEKNENLVWNMRPGAAKTRSNHKKKIMTLIVLSVFVVYIAMNFILII
ncbi:DotU family type IV/VI secretion system protein [Enterobacteriaceae bacterium LUAb1]